MSIWTKKKLGEVIDFIDGDRGKQYPTQGEFYDSGYCLFLSTKNVPNSKFSFEEKMFIDAEKDAVLRKGKLQRGDYVLTTRGTVGNFAYYDEKVPFENIRLNSGMVILRKKSDELDERFLRYYLSSASFSEQVKSRVSGSAQPQLPIRDMVSMEIILPDPKNQTRIASILSTYDDLIENNEKRIKVLEEMAQLLYTEWLVKPVKNGLPKGWKIKKLEDVSDVLFGYNFKSSLFNEKNEGVRVIRIRDVLSGSTETFTPEITDKKYLIEKGDLLIGMDGIFHMSMWFMDGCFLNQRVVRIRSEKLPASFIYESIKKQLYFFQKTIVGATVGHLSNGNIRDFEILIPNNDSMTKIFQEITNLTITLKLQNQNLSKTRDLLIPQLVTGKRELK